MISQLQGLGRIDGLWPDSSTLHASSSLPNGAIFRCSASALPFHARFTALHVAESVFLLQYSTWDEWLLNCRQSGKST